MTLTCEKCPLLIPIFAKTQTEMKKIILLSAILFTLKSVTEAQIFTPVIIGDIVNTISDSRSCNWVDINNDGYQDIMITNGKEGGENNMLYINNNDGTFTSVVSDTIVKDGMPSDGATWADADNDGDIDAFVVNWFGKNNMFYLNNNDNSFTQVTEGIAVNDFGYSETAAWGDYDNDGFVDLYVTNSDSLKQNYLYHNNGDATFTKVLSGDLVTDAYISRCANWIDFDLDGDADLFVTNEANQHENFYINNGDATFTKLSSDPLVMNGGKTMSSSWADVDNDGDFDVFLANDGTNNALFLNDGAGNFTKSATDIVSNDGGHSFGCNFSDIDNDGDLDLFVTNSFWGTQWNNYLYLNNGDGTFIKNTTDETVSVLGWSYGNAFGDYDKDGDMDLMVANCYNAGQENSLFNNSGNDNNWLVINLTGVISNKSAIGAIVKIKANINGETIWQMREVSAQSGYCGQNMLPVHFGLGNATQIDSIVVLWPSGIIDALSSLPLNNYHTIIEGTYSTSITTNTPNVFTISPNPGNGLFQLTTAASTNLFIYDSSGLLIQTKQLQSGTNTIDLKQQPNGNYFFVLQQNGKRSGVVVVKM